MRDQKYLKICHADLYKICSLQINSESFITFLDQTLASTTFDENCIALALYSSARSCDAMYSVREINSKLEIFNQLFEEHFFVMVLDLNMRFNGV